MSANINITHDGELDIATGKDRKTRTFRNQKILWSDLALRLSQTVRTHETYAEYISAKKTRQDEIKDVGGFVGGYLQRGRRLTGSVVHRQLITLDLDSARANTWEVFTMLYECAAVMYSTHKHAPDAPRLRLVIPLDRPVMSDEYMAICRRIAAEMGIDAFDFTSFRPTQLMYWPSTSKDGEFVYECQDGPWLSADTILATYHDWRDSSEWPVSDKEGEVIQRSIQKQGDPLEKPGIVGAFCRTYNIHEAIEAFLGDVYEPTEQEDRYTYIEGSTAAGLKVYDDRYAYSHHGTDPCSGRLCNAFDLVRIHKFGLKDEDARDNTPVNKLPSHLAMEAFAAKDDRVKKAIGAEKLQSAREEFMGDMTEEAAAPLEDEDTDWMAALEVDRKGNYYPTIDNIVIILENDPVLKGVIAYDEFESRPVVLRALPWRTPAKDTRYLTDRDVHNIEHYLEKTYDLAGTKLEKALSVIYMKHTCHPVREYLQSVKWDGRTRVETLLTDYMGADDNEYTRTVIRKTLIAAVARIFQPGVKFDHVLTLVGDEGKRKSSLLRRLGRQWFTDTFNLHMLQGKEAYEQIRGVWFVEISELAGMAKAEVERVKGFISAQEDRYRQAYGHRVENFPRQCIFTATTNKTDFLKGQTGNRRFWPVLINEDMAVKDVFRDLTDSEVDLIWAEAVELYKRGEQLYLPERLEQIARKVQKEHTEEHPWTGIVRQFLDRKLPKNWNNMNRYERLDYLNNTDDLQPEGKVYRARVCVAEIWSEALNRREAIDDRSAQAIRGIMLMMDGWEEVREPMRFGIYGLVRRGFRRVGVPDEYITKLTKERAEEAV